MRKLFYIPLEEYDRRYTADWVVQFVKEFDSCDIDYEVIKGNPTSTSIDCGDVLDAYNTHLYKFSQLSKIIHMIQTKQITAEDTILFADGWFPGVESLAYIRNVSGINFKLACIVHAGTWDPQDFTCRFGMREWGKDLENSWFSFYDYVFVATEFHKQLIMSRNGVDGSNIYVTGIPFYAANLREKYLPANKENIVIFPHRCNEEKHPELFDALAKEFPNYKFIKSIEICPTRDKYFNLLAKSKIMVSFADQETFGFATVEAAALDNYVIVPDKLSYKETIPEEYRYKCKQDKCCELDIPEVIRRIKYFIDNEDSISFNYDTIYKYENAISNMVNILKEGASNGV